MSLAMLRDHSWCNVVKFSALLWPLLLQSLQGWPLPSHNQDCSVLPNMKPLDQHRRTTTKASLLWLHCPAECFFPRRHPKTCSASIGRQCSRTNGDGFAVIQPAISRRFTSSNATAAWPLPQLALQPWQSLLMRGCATPKTCAPTLQGGSILC